MANIAREPNGRKRIQWVEDGKRKTLRIGEMNEANARSMLGRVEKLLALKVAGERPSGELAEWLRNMPEEMLARLVRVGLVADKSVLKMTLRNAADELLSASMKPSTEKNYRAAIRELFAHFGEARLVSSITETEAQQFKKAQLAQGLAAATVAKYVKVSRQLFRRAVRAGVVSVSPFDDVVAGSQTNATRLRFVSREDILRVIEAAPSNEWRLAIALARFCGLRVPSELAGLRWVDVNWARSRMTIRSVKTERIEGHETRVVPIMPEVSGFLTRAFEQAPEGAEFVFSEVWRREGANRGTHLKRLIVRAGVQVWPKAWQNLRASAATEIAEKHPAHVCAAWLGHSITVAREHYLTVRESDFTNAIEGSTQAAQNPAQSSDETTREAMKQGKHEVAQLVECDGVALVGSNSHSSLMPPEGLEPSTR